MNNIIITDNNIHIEDSHKTSKKDIPGIIDELRYNHSENKVIITRWRYSLIMEWISHNFLYQINYKRERTADADLNVMAWYMQLLYCICGTFVYVFVK